MSYTEIEKWGLHTILDITDCYIEEITNPDSIELWLIELVDLLDMEAYGAPHIVHFGKDDKAGYSAVQLISTSNICAHFSEDTNSAYIDIFSCKPYDPQDALELCLEVFGGDVRKFEVIQR